MDRARVVIVAVLLAGVGAVAPIAAALYLSWTLALDAEQRRLALFAQRVIARADDSYSQALDVLHTIESAGLEPCSEAHISRMRTLAINSAPVEEVGYFENGQLKCTSWGPTPGVIAKKAADYRTADGVEVTVRMQPLVTRSKPMMVLHYKSHNVLVDPGRFVDVIADNGVRLAIANDKGHLISVLNAPDPALLQSLVRNPAGRPKSEELYAVAYAGGWVGIATEPRDELLGTLRRQQMLFVPIGAFIAAFIVGIVVWFSRRRLSPQGELAMAVRRRAFVVHYQPIIQVQTGACVGAEALVRWRQPDGSLVMPARFIPLAEETGLIQPITDQVVEAVMADLASVLVADSALHISINVCPEDIRTGRILPVIAAALERANIPPRQIWLEVTERSFVHIDAARETLAKARALGHPVAIDDFGTGYSSLQYLQGLPMDALKIDKLFIEAIGLHAATSSVTGYIIDMARELNLQVIAEGVETKAQADYLRARNVAFAQGWLYSAPLPATEFIAFLRRGAGTEAARAAE